MSPEYPELIVQSDAAIFASQVRVFLENHEGENSLFLGLLEGMETTPPKTDPFLAYITHRGGIILAVLFNERDLVITDGGQAELQLVAERLKSLGIDIPGVVGPAAPSKLMAELWSQVRSCNSYLAMDQRIYKLTRVIHPQGVPGSMRLAVEADIELLAGWLLQFHREASPLDPLSMEEARTHVTRWIEDRGFFIWDLDGRPVAMTALARSTAHGISLRAVYTPHADRRKGHASALVAAVSEEGLRRGKRFCVLYTDLANPTSNSIYQKIGYQPLIDSRHYRFRY